MDGTRGYRAGEIRQNDGYRFGSMNGRDNTVSQSPRKVTFRGCPRASPVGSTQADVLSRSRTQLRVRRLPIINTPPPIWTLRLPFIASSVYMA